MQDQDHHEALLSFGWFCVAECHFPVSNVKALGLKLTLPTCSKILFTATAIVVKYLYTVTKIHQKL